MSNMNQTIDQQHFNSYHRYQSPFNDMYHPHNHYSNSMHRPYSTTYNNTNQPTPSLSQTTTPSIFLTQQHQHQQQQQQQYDENYLYDNLNDNNLNNMYCEQNLPPIVVTNNIDNNSDDVTMLHDFQTAQPTQTASSIDDWLDDTQMILPPTVSSSSTDEQNNYYNQHQHQSQIPMPYNNNNIHETSSSSSSASYHHQHQHEQSHQQQIAAAIATATALRRFEPASSNSREQRNLAEKMRRDKINKLINELGKLVPFVVDSPKRVDKTSILRLTSVYLRIKQLAMTLKQLKYDETNNDNIPVESMIQLVCDQLGAFFMVLSTTGKIVMVSQMVETLLDRSYTDLMGQSIYEITHPDDHLRIKRQLSHNPPSHISADDTGGNLRRNFDVRIVCSRSRSEPISYERVSITGTLILDRYLICMVKICKPTPLYEQLLEARKDEYVTRHFIDGTIINCDQRISVVAGYMTQEVTGLSAFRFIHREDVRWTMIALRQMYDRGESRGSSCYRLMTRTGKFIYLRTYGYLEVDKNGTVESFVCVNTLVSEKEGQDLIRELKERYSALIHPTNPLSLTNGDSTAATVEDPRQLDIAIKYLIHKLPVSPASPETKDCIDNSDSSSPPPKRPCTESSIMSTSTSISSPSSTTTPQQQQSQQQQQHPTIIQSQNTSNTYNNNTNNNNNNNNGTPINSHDRLVIKDEPMVDYQQLDQQNTVINSPNSLLSSMEHLPVTSKRPL